ncbi:HBL181Cp [Eremothecium sinecaudum]|uniref:HBL181Cp n=1 Tax=Eremothecium sinecaudum TaxID=45286 RepID=A0A120K0W1_9SACH|nr:HBL181Cp [Eremothecium sinecaudum]AMD18721.1 HBL181Cp [Eremothecium sinecaudum]
MSEMDSRVPRKRVSKACDTCRAKKIKCDGKDPCLNCEKYSLCCTYTYVMKKRQAASTRVSNRKLLGDLSSRLHRLEQLLVDVSSKLQGQDTEGQRLEGFGGNAEIHSPVAASDYDSDEVSDDVSIDKSSRQQQTRGTTDIESSPLHTASDVSDAQCLKGSQLPVLCPDKADTYFGNHSSIGIFSKRGLSYLHMAYGKSADFLLPLIRLNNFVKMNHEMFYAKFLSPRTLNLIPPWPTKEQCEELFQVFLYKVLPLYPVISPDQATAVFSRINESIEDLNITDQFLVGTIMLLAVVVKGFNTKEEINSKWDEMGNNMLIRTVNIVQSTWTSSVPDPIGYMQALIFLCIYLENSPVPRMTYLQLASAIRIGQTLGLHRRETYMNIKDPVEKRRRLDIWWWCYRYDKMFSAFTGKPSLIHEHDNTSFNDWDFYQLLHWQVYPNAGYDFQPNPPAGFELEKQLSGLLDYASKHSIHCLAQTLPYHYYKLYSIQGYAYVKLLCSKASTELSPEGRFQCIKDIVERLDTLKESLPEILKPNYNLESIAEMHAKLVLMRQADEDIPLVNHIYSKILIFYIKFYWTYTLVCCSVVQTPWVRSTLPETIKIAKPYPFLADSAENAANLLKLVDHMFSHDEHSHMLTELLMGYLCGFLSVVGSMFLQDEFELKYLLLLTQCSNTVVSVARRRRGIYTFKWAIVALVTIHILKLAVGKYNMRVSALNSDANVLDTASYTETLDSLHEMLHESCILYSNCFDDSKSAASAINMWPIKNSQPGDWFGNKNPDPSLAGTPVEGYHAGNLENLSDITLAGLPPMSNPHYVELPLFDINPNSIVEEVLANVDVDFNFDGLFLNDDALEGPRFY